MPVTKDNPNKRTPAQQFVVDVENSTDFNEAQKVAFCQLAALVDPGATKAGYSRDKNDNLEKDEAGNYIRQWGVAEKEPTPATGGK